jgi:glycosyltransferase involved in cell wall biosynthesis
VARHVLRALHEAGHRVDCLGVNAVADFPDKGAYPYNIAPASMGQQDPLGFRMLLRLLGQYRYDVLFVQNDVHVAHTAAAHLRTLRSRGTHVPPIVYYFPVDCSVRADMTGMLEMAEVIATCTTFGQRQSAKAFPQRPPIVIPHGVDNRVFRPLAEREAVRRSFRAKRNLPEDALVVCSVAANSIRKDLARTIAAFARLRETHPRASVLYLHTTPVDNGLDMAAAARDCGLAVGRDVLFPAGYHALQGLTDEGMNEIYNASDVYLTTTLGEGWGLPITEAMAAGLPVVAPRNSSLLEIGGEGRAILYECRERVWVDNSGYRPLGLLDDIVAALRHVVTMPEDERRRLVEAARAFTSRLEWAAVARQWVPVVNGVLAEAAARRAAGPASAPAPASGAGPLTG